MFGFLSQLFLWVMAGFAIVPAGTSGQGTPTNSNDADTDMDTADTPVWVQQLAALLGQRRNETTTEPTKQMAQLAEYDGNRQGLATWITQARAKLEIDYKNCSPETQFWALYNRLRGRAAQQLQTWVDQVSHNGGASPDALFHQLRLAFDDWHKKEKAQRLISTIRQGNKDFYSHYLYFRQLLSDADGLNWPDEVKKNYFNTSLSLELQRALIGQVPNGITFDAYLEILSRIDEQLEGFKLRTSKLHKPVIYTATQNDNDRMDWQPTRPVQVATTSQRRAKWVSNEEINQRRQQGRCFRCGDLSHRVNDCPYLPARRPSEQKPVVTAYMAEVETIGSDKESLKE